MIVVTVELWPYGYEENKQLLHKVWIWNDATAHKDTVGNYGARLSNKGGKGWWKVLKVRDFPRKRLNSLDLLYRVLREALGERNK